MESVLILTINEKAASKLSPLTSKQKREDIGFSGYIEDIHCIVFPISKHILNIDLSVFGDKDVAPEAPILPRGNYYKRKIDEQYAVSDSLRNSFLKIIGLRSCSKIVLVSKMDFEDISTLVHFVKLFNEANEIPISFASLDNLNEKVLLKAVASAIEKTDKSIDLWERYYHIGMMRGDINVSLGIMISRLLRTATGTQITFGTQQTRLIKEVVRTTFLFMKKRDNPECGIGVDTEICNMFLVEGNGTKKKLSKKDTLFKLSKFKSDNGALEVIGTKSIKISKKVSPWMGGDDVSMLASKKLENDFFLINDPSSGLVYRMYEKGIITNPHVLPPSKMSLEHYDEILYTARILAKYYGVDGFLEEPQKKNYLWTNRKIYNRGAVLISNLNDIRETLDSDERVIYDIVAKNIISVFMPDPVLARTIIAAKYSFSPSDVFAGNVDFVETEGWKCLYAPKDKRNEHDYGKLKKIETKIFYTECDEAGEVLHTKESIYQFAKSKGIGQESTYAMHILNILDERKIKKGLVRYHDDKKHIVATTAGTSLVLLLPRSAIDALEIFNEYVVNPFISGRITLRDAINRKNEIIDRAVSDTINTLSKSMNEDASEHKFIENIKKFVPRKNKLPIPRVRCPICDGRLFITSKYYFVCENNKSRRDASGNLINTGTCDFIASRNFSIGKWVHGEIPVEKDVLKKIFDGTGVELNAVYSKKNGGNYDGKVFIRWIMDKRRYDIDPLNWKD